MKAILRVSVVLVFVTLLATTAVGQYGLYGSPDLVQLPAANTSPAAFHGSHRAPAHPSPAAQPQPQPQPHLHPQAAWRYAQAPAYSPARQPLLPASPRYALPRYATPVAVQPHPGVANYYHAPGAGHPNGEPQQAIPVPPNPPGMAVSDASPSDAVANNGGLHSTPRFLDYDAGFGYCGSEPRMAPGHAACSGNGFGYGACGTGCQPCPWYSGVSALFMNRNSANRLWTSYEDGNFPNQLMHTDMIGLKWRAGAEIKVGRRFGCCGQGPWALQATYFTIDPFSGSHVVTHPNHVSSVLTLGNVYFHGWGANNWFDWAQEHRLWRRNEIHNVEVSFVRRDLSWMQGSRFDCDFEFGVRYFRFWEHLTFGTLAGEGRVNPDWNQRAFLEDKVANNLVGFQFGANLGYHFHPSCRIFAAPKFGIYNNYVDHYFIARLGDGTVGTVLSPPSETYPVNSSTNALAFLTQLDVGLDWQVTERFSAQIGYRVIVATGMALADHQIPHFVNDIPEIAHTKTNGELVLHGAFVGLTYNY